MNVKQLQISAWIVSSLAALLAIIAWGQGVRWDFRGLSTYRLFPLFGLLAFSLMWSHYISASLRQYIKADKKSLHDYFEVTSLLVLFFILLHPGLLAWQLWRDGIGLPPGSYFQFVSSSLKLYIIMGIVSLVTFLAYEFRRKFSQHSWWQFIQYASDGAMVLIFIHALNLGGQLQEGWFRYIWFFYGVTLLMSLMYIYAGKFLPAKNN